MGLVSTRGQARQAPRGVRRLSVLLADDDPRQRALLARGLAENGLDVVAAVRDTASAVTAVATYDPDVCLLDLRMPGNGLIAAEQITHLRPELPVIMLTVSEDAEDLFNALRAGA